MTLAHPAPMSIDVPEPGAYTIRLRGHLDRLTGARLLRLVDARLQLARLGHAATRHVLIDVADVDSIGPGALAALTHALHAADRSGVTLDLVGAGALAGRLGTADRQALARFRSFPTVAAALAGLAAEGS
ncbi:STAS domain-containing protein [Pseudonocardia sp. RS010]|uniref:STAS domain-containing protein n=1 Tax=Pseudonocardia sp. RS010 TaxID=3385979 RepID=UPI00399FA261